MSGAARRALALVAMATALVATWGDAQAISFRGLGQERGNAAYSAILSADGSTVAATTMLQLSPGDNAYGIARWREDSGWEQLGSMTSQGAFVRGLSADGSVVVGSTLHGLAPGAGNNLPPCSGATTLAYYGVSADGSLAAGTAFCDAATVGYPHPFYARADSGIIALGVQPGASWSRVSGSGGVGRSGEILVGQSDWQRPFRWTRQGGYESAPPELRTYAFSEPFLSRDERVIAGTGLTPLSEISGYVWTEDGVTFLGDLPGGRDDSRVNGMSADGSILFGVGFVSDVRAEFFRWTASEGMVGLGIPAYYVDSGPVLAVSAEGDVFYGTLRDADERAVAFIWEEGRGALALEDFLAGYGLDLTGWELGGVAGLSDDGTTIMGWGVNPDGANEAWIAVVPEPSSGLLAALGAVCTTAFGRRWGDARKSRC